MCTELTNTQASKICKVFADGSSVNTKFSKTQLSKMIQSGGILSDLLADIPQVMFLTGIQALKREAKKVVTLAKNAAP